MTTAIEYLKERQEKLDLYTTAITRAHGAHHPEVFEVRAVYTTIQDKIKATGMEPVVLDQEFAQLRRITHDYVIPDDVCETFAATYHMLAKADRTYQEEN